MNKQERKEQGKKEDNRSHCLWVQVKPRSSRDRIAGFNEEGFLVIHVRALPERGEANQSCCMQLARALQLPRSNILLEKGRTTRRKKFRIEGLSREQGEIRLGCGIRATGKG